MFIIKSSDSGENYVSYLNFSPLINLNKVVENGIPVRTRIMSLQNVCDRKFFKERERELTEINLYYLVLKPTIVIVRNLSGHRYGVLYYRTTFWRSTHTLLLW